MLKEGLYEELISEKLKGELAVLEEEKYDVSKDKLDVEEARKRLSSYISNVTRKALRYIREDFSAKGSKEALLKQIKTCNEIIETLAQNLDNNEFEKLKLSEEGEVLTSIYSKLNSVRALRKVEEIRPATPLSESSLFTGSHYEPNMLGELQKEILTAREYKSSNGYTSPFIFLGACEYVSHTGEKSMSIVWKLKEEVPPSFVPMANKSIL